MGAKVNGRLVPLESELHSGDSVEVFTSKNPDAGPSQDWLNFVKSTRARNKIRAWFTKERREEAIEQGKDAIARAMRKQNLPLQKLMSQDSFAQVASQMRYDDVSALYAAVGEGHVSTQSVIEKVVASLTTDTESDDEVPFVPKARSRALKNSDSGVLVRGAPDILVKLAKCCTPVPGDEIVGFVTRGAGVSVHRGDCNNVKTLDSSSRWGTPPISIASSTPFVVLTPYTTSTASATADHPAGRPNPAGGGSPDAPGRVFCARA